MPINLEKCGKFILSLGYPLILSEFKYVKRSKSMFIAELIIENFVKKTLFPLYIMK